MKFTATNEIDAYRIGESHRLARVRRRHGVPGRRRRSSDRWGRNWQAEWDGCEYAPRAWTRWGVRRKARRWQRRGTEKMAKEFSA